MGLFVGSTPVKQVYVGSTPVIAVYVGSQKVWPTWPTTVQITLGTGNQAGDQFRAALADRGLDYTTVTELPFDIELVGTGSVQEMFDGCAALTTIPPLDTSQVTDMTAMFFGCSSLVSVPDLITSNVEAAASMFYGCSALTDGNVRLIGRHQSVYTSQMITNSGLTREPFYKADGTPDDGITIEVHEVSFSGEYGRGKLVPLVSVTIPAGDVWAVRVQGQFTRTTNWAGQKPQIRIGPATSGEYSQGEVVDFSGTVSSSDSTIAAVINRNNQSDPTDFVGTVTIEK